MPQANQGSGTSRQAIETERPASQVEEGPQTLPPLNELLEAVHAAALHSIGLIAEAERSAIVHLHGPFAELISGRREGVTPPSAYIPGARVQLPTSVFGIPGIVNEELANAYRRSLVEVIEADMAIPRELGLIRPRLTEQPGAELVDPFPVHAILNTDERDFRVPIIAGAGLAIQAITTNFDQLVGSMMPSPAALHASPEAIVEAARRRAELRTYLLATGALTYRDLAEGRSMSPAAVRQWVRRARERDELFSVEHQGETFIPALLLDEDLSPRHAFQPVIEVLKEAGEDGWGLWAWLTFPSPWLDGAVPAEVLVFDPERVITAAVSRASNAA
jgi:hypothetical protein